MTVPPLLPAAGVRDRPAVGGPDPVRRDGRGGPDLLLVQRSPWLRRHAGQPAFPGGAIDAADHGPVGAALREAAEEAGVDPAGVEVLAVLPELYISAQRVQRHPGAGLVAHSRCPVRRRATGEVTAAVRIPVADLADPAEPARGPAPVRLGRARRSACTAC